MMARTGVILLSSIQWVAMNMPSAPSPTPMTADTKGMPEATREPKVKMSTIKATPRPMISEVELTAISSPKPAPLPSTVRPRSRAMFIASVTVSLSACSTL